MQQVVKFHTEMSHKDRQLLVAICSVSSVIYVNLLVTLKNGENKSENTSTSQMDFTLIVSCCFGSCLCGRDKMSSKVSTTMKKAVVLF